MKPAECHPEQRHFAKGLCARCYNAGWRASHRQRATDYAARYRKQYPEKIREWKEQRMLADPVKWADLMARSIESLEHSREERQRIDAWVQWPSPSMRFLAPIGEMPWNRHGDGSEIKSREAMPDLTGMNPPDWTRDAALAKRGRRRPKAGELLDPMWSG